MFASLTAAASKLRRDRHKLSVGQLLAKSRRYVEELVLARLYLRGVTYVGHGVRTLRAPRIDNQGTLKIGPHTLLRSVNVPVELACGPGAELTIGAQCSLNYGVSIGCTKRIEIGPRTRIGPYVMVVDTDFHHPLRRGERPEPRPVVIESDVWIGAKASIMPGVRIGQGAIVGTGAVVTRDVAPFSVVAGVPARMIKTLDPSQFVAEETLR